MLYYCSKCSKLCDEDDIKFDWDKIKEIHPDCGEEVNIVTD